jgi:hypothetical protein
MKKILAIILMAIFLLPGLSLAAEKGKVKLMIPARKETEKTSQTSGYWMLSISGSGIKEYSEEDLKEFVKKFEGQGYKVDYIEIWIEAKAESGGVTTFFVSLS